MLGSCLCCRPLTAKGTVGWKNVCVSGNWQAIWGLTMVGRLELTYSIEFAEVNGAKASAPEA